MAEELTARVFVTVARKHGQCRGNAAGWLWSIVRSELATHFRRERPASPLACDLPGAGEAPDARAIRQEEQAEMFDALGQLTPGEQEIVYMKFFQDMPNVEIARATGRKASGVGVAVFRALQRLRSLLRPRAARGRAGEAIP